MKPERVRPVAILAGASVLGGLLLAWPLLHAPAMVVVGLGLWSMSREDWTTSSDDRSPRSGARAVRSYAAVVCAVGVLGLLLDLLLWLGLSRASIETLTQAAGLLSSAVFGAYALGILGGLVMVGFAPRAFDRTARAWSALARLRNLHVALGLIAAWVCVGAGGTVVARDLAVAFESDLGADLADLEHRVAALAVLQVAADPDFYPDDPVPWSMWSEVRSDPPVLRVWWTRGGVRDTARNERADSRLSARSTKAGIRGVRRAVDARIRHDVRGSPVDVERHEPGSRPRVEAAAMLLGMLGGEGLAQVLSDVLGQAAIAELLGTPVVRGVVLASVRAEFDARVREATRRWLNGDTKGLSSLVAWVRDNVPVGYDVLTEAMAPRRPPSPYGGGGEPLGLYEGVGERCTCWYRDGSFSRCDGRPSCCGCCPSTRLGAAPQGCEGFSPGAP